MIANVKSFKYSYVLGINISTVCLPVSSFSGAVSGTLKLQECRMCITVLEIASWRNRHCLYEQHWQEATERATYTSVSSGRRHYFPLCRPIV